MTSLVTPIINVKSPLEKILKIGEYIAINGHNTSGDNNSESYEINLRYFGKGSREERLVGKEKVLNALEG